MTATRGPVPKPSFERRRRNKSDMAVTTAPSASTVEPPSASDAWHPMAREWFAALADSGQVAFIEPSDWQKARFAAELMSRMLQARSSAGTPAVSGNALSAWLSMTSGLMVTEGDRRRLRIVLQRATAVDEDEAAAVTAITNYRGQLDEYRNL